MPRWESDSAATCARRLYPIAARHRHGSERVTYLPEAREPGTANAACRARKTSELHDVGELADVFAATHREVGLAAAFAAEFLAGLRDEFAGLETGFHRRR